MISPEMATVQALGERPVFALGDLLGVAGSRASAYRILRELLDSGFASRVGRGHFLIRTGLYQPYSIWEHLLPSLTALKHARYFGRSYNSSDVNVARRMLSGTITLDYRAYELTGFQYPQTLFLYVDDVASAVSALRGRGFGEGVRGRVAIMPQAGLFHNELQRVYLDCLAYGGRSVLDAIAIEILHGEKIDPKVRGMFRSVDVLKVRDELSVG